MSILFIHPENQETYPIQIGALSAFLKKYGYAVQYLPLKVHDRIEVEHLRAIGEKIKQAAPILIAFSCYETSYAWLCKIAEHVKNISGIPTVIGGYYPTPFLMMS